MKESSFCSLLRGLLLFFILTFSLVPLLTDTGVIWLPKLMTNKGALIAQLVKNPPEMKETPVQLLGQEDLLENG